MNSACGLSFLLHLTPPSSCYTDLVNEKQPKVRAVALMLRDPGPLPPDSIEEAGVIIADLADDLMLAHKAMWAEYPRQKEE